MIDGGYKSTKTHIDQIRNEIEVQRLHIESERAEMSVAKAELE